MELIILIGVGFIGIMIIALSILSIGIRKVSAPSKKLEDKVNRLEKELDTWKN